MDPSSLSANWKKLQATLTSSKSETQAVNALNNHGVKRKRAASQRTADKPTVETPKPKKRLRVRTTMTETDVDSTQKTRSIKELENAHDLSRLRWSAGAGAASDKVNAGLSLECVAQRCDVVFWLTSSQGRDWQIRRC
jgi:hypothetical protein